MEWASGIAPGANITVYATNEVNNDDAERIYARAVSDASASGSTLHTFSSSYGPTESALSTTEKNAYNNYFLSMTAAGLTYLNASGDIGSGNGTTLTPEAYGDCPYATGVGGTNLQVNTTTDARTSEVVWGRDSNGTTSGSSGGLSKFFAKPAWQTGAGTPTGNFRGIPDIALAADYINSPAYYYTNGSAGEVGGTSWSAPTFAGFLAMIQQGRTLNSSARGRSGLSIRGCTRSSARRTSTMSPAATTARTPPPPVMISARAWACRRSTRCWRPGWGRRSRASRQRAAQRARAWSSPGQNSTPARRCR